MIGVNRFAIKYYSYIGVIGVNRSSNLECDETQAQNLLTVLVLKCGTIPGRRNMGTCYRPWCSCFVICHGTSFYTVVYVQ